MATPSTPVYVLPGSILQPDTVETLLTTFRTMSALETIGIPPNLLTFHDVSATTHQCSSPDELLMYHLQNKEELVSVEPVIVLDDQSEGKDGTVLVIGSQKEKDGVSSSEDYDNKQPAQTAGFGHALPEAQPYPRVRVIPTWINPLVANLSIGQQDLALYRECAQPDGAFRGFPDIV